MEFSIIDVFFFFSSRRRHTRCSRDWSSDVCFPISFLAMTARDPPEARRVMAKRGAWTCGITLTAFALGGSLIFRLFGITIGAFKIAGGILIGLNALDMVQARRSQQRETAIEKAEGIEKEDVGIM